jgi:hypothetical protein
MKIGISRISGAAEEAYRVLESAHHYGFAGVQPKPAQYNDFVAAPQSFKERYGELSYLACGGLLTPLCPLPKPLMRATSVFAAASMRQALPKNKCALSPMH